LNKSLLECERDMQTVNEQIISENERKGNLNKAAEEGIKIFSDLFTSN
jgi:hypothetical protein